MLNKESKFLQILVLPTSMLSDAVYGYPIDKPSSPYPQRKTLIAMA
ncbi:hypothetical protein HMPREF9176_1202 [Streptococcus downei F0415]|nr:hypothetical protein HMPREF9176_1202 [Streptococcus downei F0415]